MLACPRELIFPTSHSFPYCAVFVSLRILTDCCHGMGIEQFKQELTSALSSLSYNSPTLFKTELDNPSEIQNPALVFNSVISG